MPYISNMELTETPGNYILFMFKTGSAVKISNYSRIKRPLKSGEFKGLLCNRFY